MILIAGAGAMADAAAAMRRQQRQINRRIRLSRLRAKARRPVIGSDYEPEETDFACVYLCPSCSYFVPPEKTDGVPEAPCVACGETEWFDLSKEPLAGRIRHEEWDRRVEVPWYITQAVGFGSLAVFGVILVGLFAAGIIFHADYSIYACVVAAVALVAVPLAYHRLPRPLAVWWLRGRQKMPHRWHVPCPLPQPEHEPTNTDKQLVAQRVDNTIEAPISGRECLAYEICVLFDAVGDARPPEWALQEQRAVTMKLGDELEVGPEQLYLETPVEQMEFAVPEDTGDSEESESKYTPGPEQFLRKRGLYIDDGTFLFYEACLQPGDEVDVADHDGEMYVLRHSDAPPGDKLPELPRQLD